MENTTDASLKVTPRIYVASLADYNAGRLIGRWIEVQDADAIRKEISEMMKQTKEPYAEEWAIHDFEGFHGLQIEEYSSIDDIVEGASLLQEHGRVFAGLVNYCGGLSELEQAKKYMSEGYRGEYEKLERYAEELIEECYSEQLKELPDFIRYHIDYEGIARDMEMGGDVFTVECDHLVHVFDAQV